jgi:hypothetical protein
MLGAKDADNDSPAPVATAWTTHSDAARSIRLAMQSTLAQRSMSCFRTRV